jgi:predicted alpha-1,6-mannanase (GH76 family)
MKLKLALIFCVTASSLSAQIVSGDALKINSCYTGKKAIFMKDATLDDNAAAIVWTETNVPAQRWIATDAGDGLFFLTNAYSERPLSNSSNRPNVGNKIVLKSNNSTFSKWQFVPVGNPAYPNAYYIRFSFLSGDDNLYLEQDANTDGSTLSLQIKRATADSLRQMWTVTAENILPNRVTPALRDSVMRGWKDRYYDQLKNSTGFWGEAEMLETILDGYETTGKQEYKIMFEEVYAHFVSYPAGWYQPGNGTDWRWNSFNDDIAWAVLASVRAYLMFGTHPNSSINYLTIAKQNYDWMYSRALLSTSGMLRWNEDPSGNRGSNSCINGPAEVAACYLAIATGDDSYWEKAKNLYAKQRQYLYEPSTGKVFDSGSWNEAYTAFTVGNTWVSTYNQGTFLGAAVMLYNHYGAEQYKNDAHKIAEWTRNDLCNARGVIKVCGNNDDLQGFKGILMRYLRRYIVDLALPEKVDWMKTNVLQAYNNRNSAGVIWTSWWVKSAEGFVFPSDNYSFANKPFGASTAVSAAFNAPLSADVVIKDAFKPIEAENFDYVKGIYVKRSDASSAVVSNTDNGYYTAYYNVDFGDRTATGVELLVQNSSNRSERQLEVRLDGISGTLLGTATVPLTGASSWTTVSCAIPNTTGRHPIYLVYKGKDLEIDSFRFTGDDDGIDNRNVLPHLNVYPNPATIYLQVDCPQEGGLVVYNALGKEISSAAVGNGTVTLNVANYQSGVYFVSIITKEGNYTAKFLKK